jgi:GNAT superfamily N-acetyltransferase
MDPRLRSDDLAPGDRGISAVDWSDLSVHVVTGPEDPDFGPAFDRLWAEFGPRGEMERREVIGLRLRWDPARPVAGAALLYELLVLRRRGAIVAVRDHTAVVRLEDRGRPRSEPTVVHLSHALIEPAHRGSGLAGWLRALPLEAARRCGAVAGRGQQAPVVLVAEMEHPDPADSARMARLRSYGRAGFLKIDPAALDYCQPDFRAPEPLGAGGPRAAPAPLRLALIVRRVGMETETTMPAAEVEAVVASIYAVYGVHVPPGALAPLRAAIAACLARQPAFRLLPPAA